MIRLIGMLRWTDRSGRVGFDLPMQLNVMHRVGFIAAALMAGQFAQADWPQFRGPDGDGHSKARGLPLTWSETENIEWKTAIHGRGWSSPVVIGDLIWITTATEDGRELSCWLSRRIQGRSCAT